MSQERGRTRGRLQSLSPPQRAKSRSHSRGRSRSRDPSPFSLDSRLSNNYNPFQAPVGRDPNDYLPILEDDEANVEFCPVLPQFSSPQNNSRRVDTEDEGKIPLPAAPVGHVVTKEIDEDFRRQFYKDAKEKDVKKEVVKKKRKNDDKDSFKFAAGVDGSNSTQQASSREAPAEVNNSSSDYSLDTATISSSEESATKQNELTSGSNSYQFDHSSSQEGTGTSNVFQQRYQEPFHEGLSNNSSLEYYPSRDSGLLNEAFRSIDNKQSESQVSSVLKWLGKLHPRFSVGNLVATGMKHDHHPEEYEMHTASAKTDIESQPLKRNSSSKNIFKMANRFIHGKPLENDFYSNSDFDEILSPFDGRENKEKVSKNGITSNLMRLYSQLPEFSDDEILSEEDDENGDEEGLGRLENPSANIPKKMVERVRKFKNNGLFSREGSKERIHSRERDKSRDRDNTDSIKLPDFRLQKEDKRVKKIKRKVKKEKAARITVHIVDLIHRQEFLLTLCKAFMLFGAPNHRLEEYMTLTAKVLEVEATFIYLPGMMLANFSDPVTRTSDLKLVRVGQGLNLNKLDQAHDIYESVVYDRIGVEEASQELADLFSSKEFLNTYWIIFLYGLSSMFVLIFFNGAWLDMIPAFCMGALLGFLQCVVAPKNALYSSVFEVGSAILLSFIGRAIGSIANGKYFCFSAIVLSGLSMILPGYMILRGALEIQSKSIVSGVVGMFYAIIYSLFLGFGLTLGAGLYGWIDKSAISETTCSNIGHIGNIWKLLFVPFYNVCMSLSCQARFHQLSIMVAIACCGYVVTYFSSLHFTITQFNSALGSFTVGLLSNVYDRWLRSYKRIGYCSTKFTSMICGIFDLVPGGFAARNVLSSGLLELENQTNVNGTATTDSKTGTGTLTFGISMIEIAIGITVGLFISTLVVYPLGRKNTHSGNSIGL